MDNTVRSTNKLLEQILSGDPDEVWVSSCTIQKWSQDKERIKEFIPYLDEIREKTKNLNMGGLLVSKDRYIKKVIKILEHYKNEQECSCCLFDENDKPTSFETVDIITKIYYKDSKIIECYEVKCKKCGQKYKVYEREYHYLWWEWQRM